MLKGSILQEDITIFNMFVRTNCVKPHKAKTIRPQEEIDESVTIETTTLLYQKWIDPASRKLTKT